jgi:uncharacterized repeat protein (TIGR01451 family)
VSNVVITNRLPALSKFVSGPNNLISNGVGLYSLLITNLAMPETNASGIKYYGTSFNITVTPTLQGTATNIISLGVPNDPNIENNWVTNLATIIAPSADLSVSVDTVTNYITLGDTVTYVVKIVNSGPSTATQVILTDPLPSSFAFVSCSSSAVFTNGSLTLPLGDMTVGQVLTVTIVAKPTILGKFDNRVTVDCPIDAVGRNNKDCPAPKVEVAAPSISVAHTMGRTFGLTWPVGDFRLYTATNLINPNWVEVTNPAPVIVNGQYSAPITYSNNNMFFRLKLKMP